MKVVIRVAPYGGNTGAKEDRGLDYESARELQSRMSWPDGWPVPREGQMIDLPREPIGSLFVRQVVWYPMGDEGEEFAEPFVYLVLSGRDRFDA